MDFYERFVAQIEKRYPASARVFDPRANLHKPLICPDTIPLSRNYADQAREIVSAFWELRQLAERGRELASLNPTTPDPGNFSVLMSYDFHVDEKGQLRLIEINTNASMSLIVDLLHDVHAVPNLFSKNFSEDIVMAFLNEVRLALPDAPEEIRAVIADESPEKQRMFLEFLFYQELFGNHRIKTEIADSRSLRFEDGRLKLNENQIHLVYNRDTDFYFENAEHRALREAMVSRSACITPHPHEYRLLADKQRLLELSKPGAVQALAISAEAKGVIERTLIHSWDLQDYGDAEKVWNDRKNLFFKPKRSFGGKAAYRGSAIRRNAFAEIMQGSYVVQEYVPAPSVRLKSMPEDDGFKFDLRFFAYKDQIQLAAARVWKGQITNSQTLGGGVAAIEWT